MTTQIPVQVLYDLRETTAWISGQDLHEMFYELVGVPSPEGFEYYFDFQSLDEKEKKILQSKQFSLVFHNGGTWEVKTKTLSFLDAWNLRQQIGRKNSFIVPDMAGVIVDKDRFRSEDLSFGDGFMCIKGIFLSMCRWWKE